LDIQLIDPLPSGTYWKYKKTKEKRNEKLALVLVLVLAFALPVLANPFMEFWQSGELWAGLLIPCPLEVH